MIGINEILTIKEASEWATNYTGKSVTTSNISYLIQYGRVKKIGENGSTQIDKNDLLNYYESYTDSQEVNFKERLPVKTDIRLGDSKDILKEYPNNFVDLIVTSPPYADRRKNTYGGVSPDKYVEWFLPISKELLRVLKPDGTFILNIKEKAENGERNTYVLELILALRKQGWLWTEEFVWHKKNCYPGKWPNRFRDSWERLLQFNKTKNFKMYQDAVKVPIGDWANGRLKNLSETDKIRDNAKNGSGFGKNISNWLGKETVYPTNVLHLSTECNNKNHSAAFPDALPEWFIKLFTKENDVVLDPFAGSGTTLSVAKRMARNSIGIEIMPEYVELVKFQIAQELNLF